MITDTKKGKNPLSRLFSMIVGLLKALPGHDPVKRGDARDRWVPVTVDKLYYETRSGRYFLVMKPAKGEAKESVFLSLDNVMEEMLFSSLFSKNDTTRKFLRQLGFRIESVRILKRNSSEDSAECLLRKGWARKSVRVNTVDAVRFALENEAPIMVRSDLVRASHVDLAQSLKSMDGVQDNLFAPKFIERELYNNNNEVVM